MKTIENLNLKTLQNKTTSANAPLAAPVLLSVEQIASVAAGFTPGKGPLTIAGGIRANPEAIVGQKNI